MLPCVSFSLQYIFLMQGQRQQVALQFGVNVSSIERLVRRLRDTGRVVDRPQFPEILIAKCRSRFFCT
jgi:hypothetical protein